MALALASILFLTSHAFHWADEKKRAARRVNNEEGQRSDAALDSLHESMDAFAIRNQRVEAETVVQSWFFQGASVPTSQGMLLSPPVPDRYGLVWNLASLNTTAWTTRIRFQFPNKGRIPRDDSMRKNAAFGFFISPEHITKIFDARRLYDSISETFSWKQWMEKEQFTLAGYKNPFKGVGIVFHHVDQQPQISCMVDPVQAVDLRASARHAIDWVPQAISPDNRAPEIVLHIQSHRDIVTVNVTTPQEGQQRVCELNVHLPPESYIGFSGYTGEDPNPMPAAGGVRSCRGVLITEMTLFNFDEAALMRNLPFALPPSARDVAIHLLSNHDQRFRDVTNQTRLINELSTILNAFSKQRFLELRDMGQQLGRVGDVVQDVTYATQMLHKEVGLVIRPNRNDALMTLSRSARELREFFRRSNAEHSSDMEVVGDRLRHLTNDATPSVHSAPLAGVVARDVDDFQKAVDARFKLTQLMFFLVVSASLIICGLLWRRLRHYEKQHLL